MNKSILLSIKPKYVHAILRGEKKYEFRKAIPQSNDVKDVYIYASSPIKKIVAKFSLNHILRASPEEIWKQCSKYGGISKEEFFRYYNTKTEAYALTISDLEIFEDPICPYNKFKKFAPPQSFLYYNRLQTT